MGRRLRAPLHRASAPADRNRASQFRHLGRFRLDPELSLVQDICRSVRPPCRYLHDPAGERLSRRHADTLAAGQGGAAPTLSGRHLPRLRAAISRRQMVGRQALGLALQEPAARVLAHVPAPRSRRANGAADHRVPNQEAHVRSNAFVLFRLYSGGVRSVALRDRAGQGARWRAP